MNLFIYRAGLYAGSAALLKAAGFVLFLWLARALPVSDYAAWGLLYALQTWVTAFGVVGIVEAVIGLMKQHTAEEDHKRLVAGANGAFLGTAATSLVSGAALFALLPGPLPNSGWAVALALASGGLLAYAQLQAQLVRLEEKHFASLCFNFVIPTCGLAGSAVAFAVEPSVLAFFLGSTVGLALSLAGAIFAGVGSYRVARSARDCLPILARIAPFIAVVFLGWLSGYGNTYVVKLFFSAEEVARFTFVFMLSSVMQLIATAMNQVWSPHFYRLIREGSAHDAEGRSRVFLRWQAITLGIAGALMISLYPGAIDLIGGSLVHYRSLRNELLLLVLAYVVVIPYWHCQNYFLAYDKGPSIMKVHLATGVLGVGGLVGLMLLLGPLGIYMGFLTQMALRSIGALIAARRFWRVAMNWDGVAAGTALALVGFAISGY